MLDIISFLYYFIRSFIYVFFFIINATLYVLYMRGGRQSIQRIFFCGGELELVLGEVTSLLRTVVSSTIHIQHLLLLPEQCVE